MNHGIEVVQGRRKGQVVYTGRLKDSCGRVLRVWSQDRSWTRPGVAAFPGIEAQGAVERAMADGKRPGHEVIVVFFPGAPKTWKDVYTTFIADRLFLDAAIERFDRCGGKPFHDLPRGASADSRPRVGVGPKGRKSQA